MQVAVSPSHYNLKDIVQAIEVDTAGYLNTPPNGWLAATQSNFEFVSDDREIRLTNESGEIQISANGKEFIAAGDRKMQARWSPAWAN